VNPSGAAALDHLSANHGSFDRGAGSASSDLVRGCHVGTLRHLLSTSVGIAIGVDLVGGDEAVEEEAGRGWNRRGVLLRD
jgi:hypothetical protein